MAKASDNVFPKLIFSSGSAPATPSAGQGKVYEKSSDKKLYFKNEDGTEYDLTATSTGATFVHSEAAGSGGGDFSTASTSFVDITSASVTIAATAGQVLDCWFVCSAWAANTSKAVDIALNIGGTVRRANVIVTSAANAAVPVTVHVRYTVQAGDISGGNVTVKAQAKADTSTSTIVANQSGSRVWALSVTNLG